MRSKRKKILMWCGVSFFMALISFFWIMNLKYAFRVNAQIEQESKSLQDFKKVKQNFSQALNEIEKELSEVQSLIEKNNSQYSTSTNHLIESSK